MIKYIAVILCIGAAAGADSLYELLTAGGRKFFPLNPNYNNSQPDANVRLKTYTSATVQLPLTLSDNCTAHDSQVCTSFSFYNNILYEGTVYDYLHLPAGTYNTVNEIRGNLTTAECPAANLKWTVEGNETGFHVEWEILNMTYYFDPGGQWRQSGMYPINYLSMDYPLAITGANCSSAPPSCLTDIFPGSFFLPCNHSQCGAYLQEHCGTQTTTVAPAPAPAPEARPEAFQYQLYHRTGHNVYFFDTAGKTISYNISLPLHISSNCTDNGGVTMEGVACTGISVWGCGHALNKCWQNYNFNLRIPDGTYMTAEEVEGNLTRSDCNNNITYSVIDHTSAFQLEIQLQTPLVSNFVLTVPEPAAVANCSSTPFSCLQANSPFEQAPLVTHCSASMCTEAFLQEQCGTQSTTVAPAAPNGTTLAPNGTTLAPPASNGTTLAPAAPNGTTLAPPAANGTTLAPPAPNGTTLAPNGTTPAPSVTTAAPSSGSDHALEIGLGVGIPVVLIGVVLYLRKSHGGANGASATVVPSGTGPGQGQGQFCRPAVHVDTRFNFM